MYNNESGLGYSNSKNNWLMIMYTLILNITLVDFVSKEQRFFFRNTPIFAISYLALCYKQFAFIIVLKKNQNQYHNIVSIFMIRYAIVYLTYNCINIFSCLLFILYTKLNIGLSIIIYLHWWKGKKPTSLILMIINFTGNI